MPKNTKDLWCPVCDCFCTKNIRKLIKHLNEHEKRTIPGYPVK